jgi:hypothetical protein
MYKIGWLVPCSKVLLEKLRWSWNLPPFMEPKNSILCFSVSATGLHPELAEPNKHTQMTFFNIHPNIKCMCSCPGLVNGIFLLGFLINVLYMLYVYLPYICYASRPSHISWLDCPISGYNTHTCTHGVLFYNFLWWCK